MINLLSNGENHRKGMNMQVSLGEGIQYKIWNVRFIVAEKSSFLGGSLFLEAYESVYLHSSKTYIGSLQRGKNT